MNCFKSSESTTSPSVRECGRCLFDACGRKEWCGLVSCAICGRGKLLAKMIKCDACHRHAHRRCVVGALKTGQRCSDSVARARATTAEVACGEDRPEVCCVDAGTQTTVVTTAEVACGGETVPVDRFSQTSVAMCDVACGDETVRVDGFSQTSVTTCDVASGDEIVRVDGFSQTSVNTRDVASGDETVRVDGFSQTSVTTCCDVASGDETVRVDGCSLNQDDSLPSIAPPAIVATLSQIGSTSTDAAPSGSNANTHVVVMYKTDRDHVEESVVADGPSDKRPENAQPVAVKSVPAPTVAMITSVCPDSVQSEMTSGDGGVGYVENTSMTAVSYPLVALEGDGDRQRSGMDVIFPGYSTDTVEFIDDYMCLPDDDVVVWGKSIQIGDVRTVFGHNSWLNDEAISSYMQLIVDRDPCKVYAFKAYFYPLLSSYGYQAVQSWTSERIIFDYDRVLIPIYQNSHWTLVCVDFGDKTIEYFDSLGGKNHECLDTVADYLYAESCRGTFRREFNRDQWRLLHAEDCPMQLNYDDCGVFTCINAEYLARGVRPNFTQSDVPRFRHRMCYEILTDRLLLGIGG